MTKTISRSMLGLIETLEQPGTDPASSYNWRELEDHVQYVYQALLKLDGHAIAVAKDVFLIGRDSARYQIDVYYEFEMAGVRHRVAIECKNTQRRVERNDVLAFKAKIDEFHDVLGIIVSAGGFQSGAKEFAHNHRIAALGIDEIPSIKQILGKQLRYNVIPTASSLGTPFWTLLDLETGAPFGLEQKKNIYALLFWSKNQAAKYHTRNNLEAKWQVRGLEARHLFYYILAVDSMEGVFVTAPPPNHELAHDSNVFCEIPRKTLVDEYCEQHKDQLHVRQTMVRRRRAFSRQ